MSYKTYLFRGWAIAPTISRAVPTFRLVSPSSVMTYVTSRSQSSPPQQYVTELKAAIFRLYLRKRLLVCPLFLYRRNICTHVYLAARAESFEVEQIYGALVLWEVGWLSVR